MPTRIPKTNEQIEAELAKLRELKPRIPQSAANLRQIDIEIQVLELRQSRYEIEQAYGDPDSLDDGMYYVATYARDWLEGIEDDGDLATDWEQIAKPGKPQ